MQVNAPHFSGLFKIKRSKNNEHQQAVFFNAIHQKGDPSNIGYNGDKVSVRVYDVYDQTIKSVLKEHGVKFSYEA